MGPRAALRHGGHLRAGRRASSASSAAPSRSSRSPCVECGLDVATRADLARRAGQVARPRRPVPRPRRAALRRRAHPGHPARAPAPRQPPDVRPPRGVRGRAGADRPRRRRRLPRAGLPALRADAALPALRRRLRRRRDPRRRPRHPRLRRRPRSACAPRSPEVASTGRPPDAHPAGTPFSADPRRRASPGSRGAWRRRARPSAAPSGRAREAVPLPPRLGLGVERGRQVVGLDQVLDVVEQRPRAAGPGLLHHGLARAAASARPRSARRPAACSSAPSRCPAGAASAGCELRSASTPRAWLSIQPKHRHSRTTASYGDVPLGSALRFQVTSQTPAAEAWCSASQARSSAASVISSCSCSTSARVPAATQRSQPGTGRVEVQRRLTTAVPAARSCRPRRSVPITSGREHQAHHQRRGARTAGGRPGCCRAGRRRAGRSAGRRCRRRGPPARWSRTKNVSSVIQDVQPSPTEDAGAEEQDRHHRADDPVEQQRDDPRTPGRERAATRLREADALARVGLRPGRRRLPSLATLDGTRRPSRGPRTGTHGP